MKQIVRLPTLQTSTQIAIKIEPRLQHPKHLLIAEHPIYNTLKGIPGIPEVYDCSHELFDGAIGAEPEQYGLAFELLGPTLEELLEYCGGKFSLKTVLMVADQLVARFEAIHARHVCHFGVGLGERARCVYVFDIGCDLGAGRYRRGTQIPRDDMETIGYILLRLLGCTLPWDESPGLSQTTVAKMKAKMIPKYLCEGLPSAFSLYFEHVRQIGSGGWDYPDYTYLRNIFRELFLSLGFADDGVFDWTQKRFDEIQLE